MDAELEARIRECVAERWGINWFESATVLAALDDAREQCRAAEARAERLTLDLAWTTHLTRCGQCGYRYQGSGRLCATGQRLHTATVDAAVPSPEPEQRRSFAWVPRVEYDRDDDDVYQPGDGGPAPKLTSPPAPIVVPESEQRPADPRGVVCWECSCAGFRWIGHPCGRGSVCRHHPSPGRHAGLAGQEGEGR